MSSTVVNIISEDNYNSLTPKRKGNLFSSKCPFSIGCDLNDTFDGSVIQGKARVSFWESLKHNRYFIMPILLLAGVKPELNYF